MPLHVAAAKGQEGCLRLLLESRAEVGDTCHDDQTALHFGALGGCAAVVRRLVEAEALVDARDVHGHTALRLAVREAQLDTARLLLSWRADVEAEADGLRPLHVAAERGEKELLELLLEGRADVHAKGSDGLTALDLVAIEGRKDLVQLLEDMGASSELIGVPHAISPH